MGVCEDDVDDAVGFAIVQSILCVEKEWRILANLCGGYDWMMTRLRPCFLA
jgi:hypothetical protein